jgi:hypothetical protein
MTEAQSRFRSSPASTIGDESGSSVNHWRRAAEPIKNDRPRKESERPGCRNRCQPRFQFRQAGSVTGKYGGNHCLHIQKKRLASLLQEQD